MEDFRNTPLIPISEKLIKDYKDRLEKYHRKGVFLEVRKQSIANIGKNLK